MGDDVVDAVKHPATFGWNILAVLDEVTAVRRDIRVVLDPFAGVGTLAAAWEGKRYPNVIGLELEPEWADQHPSTLCGSVLEVDIEWIVRQGPERVDAIVTSPCYGNRMADHHEARDESVRHTYRHYLGHALTPGSAAAMQWGPDYMTFHRAAWQAVTPLVRDQGWFILNIKDHVRGGRVMPVSAWHRATLRSLGWKLEEDRLVGAPGQRHGENGGLRVEFEHVMVFRKAD